MVKQRVLESILFWLVTTVIVVGLLISRCADSESLKMFFALLGILNGTAVSLTLTSLFDVVRRPQLRAKIGYLPDNDWSGDPKGRVDMETLFIDISNRPPEWPYNWIVSRNPAQGCWGRIWFYEDTPLGFRGHQNNPMTTRWRSLSQPGELRGFLCDYVLAQLQGGCLKVTGKFSTNWAKGMLIYDRERYDALGQDPQQRMDVFAGMTKDIDLVCRFKVDLECFGFNNEYYIPHEMEYRKDWILPGAHYFVHLIIYSSTEPTSFYFDLWNESDRLEAIPLDKCPPDIEGAVRQIEGVRSKAMCKAKSWLLR